MKKYIMLATLAFVLSASTGSKSFATDAILYCDCATGHGTETVHKACGKLSSSYSANVAACGVCCGPKPAAAAGSLALPTPAQGTNPIIPPTLSKVGPLTPTLESDVNTIIARELPGGESPSVAANRKKKCEDAGGTWVGGTLIIGQQANGGLGGIQYIPGHCNAAAAVTPQ